MSFAWGLVRQLRQIGKNRTAERYTTVLNSFGRFLGESDVLPEEMDSDLMVRYETFLKARGICPNSSSYYMRGLRAVYNRAVEKELTVQRNPFKHVYTGIDNDRQTRRTTENHPSDTGTADLTLTPATDSPATCSSSPSTRAGMSFVDMAYLRKKDLQNGVLAYRRQKTGQQLFIKWEKPMQEIVEKYDTSGTPYLLPIIRDMEKDARRQYKNAAHLVNAKLKKLGEQAGAGHTADDVCRAPRMGKHSQKQNIPVSTISEAMGHDSETTTRIYLASLDTSVVDKANSLILKSL